MGRSVISVGLVVARPARAAQLASRGGLVVGLALLARAVVRAVARAFSGCSCAHSRLTRRWVKRSLLPSGAAFAAAAVRVFVCVLQ